MSTTHSIVGDIIGFALVYGGGPAVNWCALGPGRRRLGAPPLPRQPGGTVLASEGGLAALVSSCAQLQANTFAAVQRPPCPRRYSRTSSFPYVSGIVPVVLSWFISPILAGLVAAIIFIIVRGAGRRQGRDAQHDACAARRCRFLPAELQVHSYCVAATVCVARLHVCTRDLPLPPQIRTLVLRHKSSTAIAYWALPVFVLLTVFINGGWASPDGRRTHVCSCTAGRVDRRTACHTAALPFSCHATLSDVCRAPAPRPRAVFFIITKGAKNVANLPFDQVRREGHT